MTDNSESIKYSINIFEVIEILIKNIFVLFLPAFTIGLLLYFSFPFLVKSTYTSSFKIYSDTDLKTSTAFSVINQINFTYDGETYFLIDQENKINNNVIMNAYLRFFQDQEILTNIFKENLILDDNLTKQEQVDYLNENIRSIIIEKNSNDATFRLSSQNEETLSKITEEIKIQSLKYINELLFMQLKEKSNKYEQIVDSIIFKKERELENIKYDYYEQSKRKVLFLSEQASLAKTIGIMEDSIRTREMLVFDDASSDFSLEDFSLDLYYLKGVKAIEAEIDILKSREEKNIANYIPEYLEKLRNLKILKEKLIINEINSEIETIFKQKSQSNFINLGYTKITSQSHRSIGVLGVFCFVLIMSMLFILYRNFRDNKS